MQTWNLTKPTIVFADGEILDAASADLYFSAAGVPVVLQARIAVDNDNVITRTYILAEKPVKVITHA